jgi:hypothetical protein
MAATVPHPRRNGARAATKASTAAPPRARSTTPPPPPAAPDAVGAVFATLRAPFPESEVKERTGPFGPLRYIDATTARRRLDEAVGPANWDMRIEPAPHWVKATLTLRLPGGATVVREAIGGFPDPAMKSTEDQVKAGDSDAVKRVCATVGIGAYLYDDPSPAPRTAGAGFEPRPAPESPGLAGVTNGAQLFEWAKPRGMLPALVEAGRRLSLPHHIPSWGPQEVAAALGAIINRS